MNSHVLSRAHRQVARRGTRDRELRMPFDGELARLARLDEPLPPTGTTILMTELTEDVALDLRALPVHVRALVEQNDPTSIDIAADWLEENGRVDGAELLRTGCALFVDGRTVLTRGYLRLSVTAEHQLSIDGRGLSAARWSARGTWALLVDRTMFVVRPSAAEAAPADGTLGAVMAKGLRVASLW